MKVVVTGATGNVGSSTVQALSESERIEEIVGLARREPTWKPAKTSWVEANVVSADLAPIFAGADAVIHLAWAIQPSRDGATLERINVDGSRRVFEAVGAAGVPKLVHASSVGVYSQGPKDREVDESWPTEGSPTSFYSRHKVAAERLLDRFEDENPETTVVRLRPGLIFKDEAAAEIRRLFVGPFLPNFLLRRGLLPALPRIERLRFQAVHSEDVGQAYLRAVLGDSGGAFNIAAEPPLSGGELAERLGIPSFPVSARVVRRLADLSWRARLQPTPPGWLDMALNVPLMSSRRAREELGWEPRRSGVEALEELLEGMRAGAGKETPPLRADEGIGTRVEDIKTGVGAKQWGRDRDEQLVKYLADVHSIELQALAQLRAAPKIAGDERLAAAFEQHLGETEDQERRVRERLEELGGKPSKLKDAAGAAGGWAMVAFAASQPDTPGKLTMHAYSYEHMELAAYELLERLAERAGDEETARMAADIAAEEARMAERLEQTFDTAVEAALAAVEPEDLPETLLTYLRDVHALEGQSTRLLEAGAERVDDELERAFREHLAETRDHAARVEALLEERGARPSFVKDAALKAGGLNLSAFFGAQPDSTTKLAGFAYAVEQLEVAAYELLARVAARAGDDGVVTAVEEILTEERHAADRIAATWDRPDVPLGLAS